MKTLSLIIALFIFVACKTETDKSKTEHKINVTTKNIKKSTTTVIENNIEKPGEFIEKYSNGNIKTEGWFNQDTKRDNVWYSYYETGIKWSEQSFKNGLKEGHSIVYYPNGKIHYSGQYANDKKTGHWIFYNEQGEITKEEDY